jgi:hypothetical protein
MSKQIILAFPNWKGEYDTPMRVTNRSMIALIMNLMTVIKCGQ